jgi:hypothetical protein
MRFKCSSLTLISIDNRSVTDAILCNSHLYNDVNTLVASPKNTISQIISFSVGNILFIYSGSIFICFRNGSSVYIILCIFV